MVSREWKRVRVVGSAGVYLPNGSWGELSCALDMDSGDKETAPQCHSQSADALLSYACSGTSCGIVYIETDISHLKIIQFNFNNLHSCTNLVKLKQYTIWSNSDVSRGSPIPFSNQSLPSHEHLTPVAHLTYVKF